MMTSAMYTVFWLSLAALVYCHTIYPAVMVACARLRVRREVEYFEDDHLPRVTLIIPAYNEEVHIEEKLSNSLGLDYPGELLDIVVVSDGSTDATVEKVLAFEDPRIRLKESRTRCGKASALNAAVAESTGDVLCLCDANVMFRPDALRRLVYRLADPAIGAVTGDVRLASECTEYGVGERLYYAVERGVQSGESVVGSVMGVDGGMYVIRRELYRELAPNTVLDDFVTTMRTIRQGRRVVYEPTAVATENGTPLASQEFGRRVRITAGAMQSIAMGEFPNWRQPVALWQYLSHKLLRWFGPVFMILLLMSNAFLAYGHSIYLAFAIAQTVAYAALVVAAVSPPLRRTPLGSILFYLAISHAAMLVGMVKGLTGKQRVTWNRTERKQEVPAAG